MPKIRPRGDYNPLWNHMVRDSVSKSAKCNYCKKTLSYRTTISNLRHHLKLKHASVYQELCNSYNNMERVTNDEAQSDADTEVLVKLSDVWSYFEQESGRRARCVVCRSTIDNGYEVLKAHLKEHHPKLLLQVMQDQEQNSDAASNSDTNENTYTEIVYLEQDPQEGKLKENVKRVPIITYKPSKKRETRISSCEGSSSKRIKETDNELEVFIKYITCLLKKLPQDAFSAIQGDIINIIIKASNNANKNNSNQLLLNNVPNLTNVISVSDVPHGNSAMLGHNYAITVATKNDEVQNIQS